MSREAIFEYWLPQSEDFVNGIAERMEMSAEIVAIETEKIRQRRSRKVTKECGFLDLGEVG